MRWFATLAVALLLPSMAAAQQDLRLDQATQQILVIDTARLFEDSAYAQKLFAEVEEVAVELRDENQRIVAALEAEEKELTEQRATMATEDFRAAAEAFDEKAQEIRRSRDAKQFELDEARRNVRGQFLREARDIVGQLMVERGADVVLDSRSVYVTVSSADITETAIARIDATLMQQDQDETTGD